MQPEALQPVVQHEGVRPDGEDTTRLAEVCFPLLSRSFGCCCWDMQRLEIFFLWFILPCAAHPCNSFLHAALVRSCKKEDGTDDLKKGTQLLEVYAIEIQMYTEQKNNKKLKQLYQKALAIKSAIPHPRIMGIIRECGGKMHMSERKWSEAATDFFEVKQPCSALSECEQILICRVLIAGLQELRRGGKQPADTMPQVPGAGLHASGE